jgi:hypothetical protein
VCELQHDQEGRERRVVNGMEGLLGEPQVRVEARTSG